MKEHTFVCQSCGMPLLKEGVRGGNADGSLSDEYCIYCFQKGAFTQPAVSMEEFIEQQVTIAHKKLGLSYEQARERAQSIIPELKRWQTRQGG